MSDEKKKKEQYAKELRRKIAELEATVKGLKREEQVLRGAERSLRAILNTAIDGVITIDDRGKIETVNPAAEALFGYARDELLGRNVRILMPEPYSSEHDAYLENYANTGGKKCIGLTRERLALKKDGTVFPIEISLSEAQLADGRMFTAIVRDITERKRVEEELLKAQKLESLSILASGIAHDFNNLLTAILGSISAARILGKKDEETAQILAEAEEACMRAKGLTRQLLSFAKGQTITRKTVSIPELLRVWVGFALRGSNVRRDVSFPDDLALVDVDEVQMSQVINNLIINARQAMPHGGSIQVRAENVKVGPGDDIKLRAGKYVRISIRDEGGGIADEHVPRIFEPFFSTKGEGSSGLGLTVSHSIVRNHEGAITAESEPGVGTTFHIWLPASEKQLVPKQEKEKKSFFGDGKLLIMDDDQAIRRLLDWSLTRFGYEVWSAKDGYEAVELYKKAKASGQPFKAVVIDLTVPGGLGGEDVIKRIRKMDPGVKAIVSSGHAGDPVMTRFREYGFEDAIAKPYRMEELGEILKKVTGHS